MTSVLTSDLSLTVIKILAVVVGLLQVPPIMLWVERRGSAYLQKRLGPNRVGPLGLIQSVADAVKFIFKEDRVPGHVTDRFWFLAAPIISVVPAFMTFAVIPFASSMTLPDGRLLEFRVTDLDVGLLYIFAISSLGIYGIIMGAWASNSKYALFGGLRSSSQMISYELSLGLSVVGLLMIFQSVDLMTIAKAQGETWFNLGPLAVPKWGILLQPIGFLVFVTAIFAETNRLPFDLAEGESEIVAGYHLEYGAMKFALFMLAEYVNMTVGSALIATLFLGGWQLLPGMEWILANAGLSGLAHDLLRIALEITSFLVKTGFFLWLFVWVRWTLPRFRYDQLMDFGWKVMLPLCFANIVVTSALMYWGVF